MKRRIPLGSCSAISLADARLAVQEILGQVARGRDPAVERDRHPAVHRDGDAHGGPEQPAPIAVPAPGAATPQPATEDPSPRAPPPAAATVATTHATPVAGATTPPEPGAEASAEDENRNFSDVQYHPHCHVGPAADRPRPRVLSQTRKCRKNGDERRRWFLERFPQSGAVDRARRPEIDRSRLIDIRANIAQFRGDYEHDRTFVRARINP